MIPENAGCKLRILPARFAAGGIRFYQRWISPLKFMLFGPGAGCRFYPTCSEYSREAVLTHGLFRGGSLAVRRLLKCHPFHPGGVDLTPPKTAERCAECSREERNSPNG